MEIDVNNSMKILFGAAAVMAYAAPAAAEAGDWYLRVRAIDVIPTESSGSILPAFPGEEVKVNNSIMPEIDITYMATNNVGFELIAATTKHTASGKTATTGAIGKLASTWVLPPTLTAQYHFAPGGKVRPYVGLGVNYTLFYSEKGANALETALAANVPVKMKSSFGWAAQAGVDVDLNEKMFLNFDVKYIDIDTTARLGTPLGTQRVKISLDPVVVGVGVGFRL
jgi:outer membrane protein